MFKTRSIRNSIIYLLPFCALLTIVLFQNCSDTVVKAPGEKVYRIDSNKCTACGLCVKPCPQNAITEHLLNDQWVVIIDPDECIACGECVPYCKYDALTKVNPE